MVRACCLCWWLMAASACTGVVGESVEFADEVGGAFASAPGSGENEDGSSDPVMGEPVSMPSTPSMPGDSEPFEEGDEPPTATVEDEQPGSVADSDGDNDASDSAGDGEPDTPGGASGGGDSQDGGNAGDPDGEADGGSGNEDGPDDADSDTGGGDPDATVDVPDSSHCAPVANWDAELVAWEQQVLRLTNEARAVGADCGSEGVFGAAPPLRMDTALRCAARLHSQDMIDRDYFDHVNPDGEAPWDRMDDAGYNWRSAGENIAAGQRSPESVVAGWLDSDGHCANIMSGGFTEIGVGVALNGNSPYWTQVFGRP